MADDSRAKVWLNVLTGSRLALVAAVAVLTLWSDDRAWAIVASTVLVLGVEGTDLLDGYLARSRGLVTQFGKMFDPYADSVSRLTVYWSLAVVGRCWPALPLVMAVRDVTVSYSRIIMERRSADISARPTGKLKALVQGTCGVALMAGPLYWGDWGTWLVHGLSGLVLAVTVASMFDYAWAAFRPAD